MAEIRRLLISNPEADTPALVFSSQSFYLMSVIAANTSPTLPTKINIWISPNDTSTESLWGYQVKHGSIDPGNSIETFRFPMNPSDFLYVSSDNGMASFTVVGINQV